MTALEYLDSLIAGIDGSEILVHKSELELLKQLMLNTPA